MALFGNDPTPPTGRSTRAAKVGWTVLGVAFATGLILAIAPAPYAIEKPGPVYNTLGTADHDGKEIPLITIPGARGRASSAAMKGGSS